MRQIKFRAWYEPDKQTKDGALKFKQVIFQDQLFFMHGLEDDEYCGRLIKYPFEVPFLDDDWTVEQFTGLVDKNGVEIYEGDIIKYANLNYKVFFEHYQWVALCPYYHKYHPPRLEYFSRAAAGEVIGNIHENPELLEK